MAEEIRVLVDEDLNKTYIYPGGDVHTHTYYLTPDSYLPDEILDKIDQDVSRIETTMYNNGIIDLMFMKGEREDEMSGLSDDDTIDMEIWIRENPEFYVKDCNLPLSHNCFEGTQ